MDKNYTVEELLSDDTFTDYCLNESSPYKKKWLDILSRDHEQMKAVNEARAMLAILSPVLPQHEIETEVNKLREALINVDGPPQILYKKYYTKKILAYSFSLLLVILASVYFLVSDKSSPVLASKFETGMGERKQYILPDGSTVILNSNSSFSFNEAFGKDDRQIEMTGDAFFKVAENPSKPFIVKSNGFSTTAIGTSFYVHAGTSAADYRVDLLEGKVKLEKIISGETSYLKAGEKALWTKTIRSFTKQQYDTVSLNKWIKGILSFNNLPVKDAFTELENWYSVKIEDRRSNPEVISINGDYVNAPLEDVLKIICFSLSCSYHFENNKIIIL
jgi:ferric-dicitrate binding protein FerR (iron transport regulator)